MRFTLNVRELKELIDGLDDETEILIRDSIPLGDTNFIGVIEPHEGQKELVLVENDPGILYMLKEDEINNLKIYNTNVETGERYLELGKDRDCDFNGRERK